MGEPSHENVILSPENLWSALIMRIFSIYAGRLIIFPTLYFHGLATVLIVPRFQGTRMNPPFSKSLQIKRAVALIILGVHAMIPELRQYLGTRASRLTWHLGVIHVCIKHRCLSFLSSFFLMFFLAPCFTLLLGRV